MKGLLVILFSTFLVGMATGVFIYFMSGLNEPLFNFPGDELTRGFEITADMDGGCQMGDACPSYRIDDSGKIVYIVRHREGEDERQEDELSSGALRKLKELLAETDLAALEDSTFVGTCPIAYDGAAYTFDIRIEEERYYIDTCEHDTEGVALFEQLIENFSELE
jgi:hypothetical protein